MKSFDDVPMGEIERVDPPGHVERNIEPCFDSFWGIDGQRKLVTVEKHGKEARLCVHGMGGDLIWWTRLDDFYNYRFMALKVDTRGALRVPVRMMIVDFACQEVDTGRGKELRSVVTKYPYSKA